MKKLIMMGIAAVFCAATISFAQGTTSSTDKSGTNQKHGQGVETAGKGKAKPAPQAKNATGQNAKNTTAGTKEAPISPEHPSGQQAQCSTENDGSTRPGGATHENANDVGKYSDNADDKSMTHSKEALAARRKNLTESDTTVKAGSGSAPKNTKNHTGKTGNYDNQEIKHNQPTPRP